MPQARRHGGQARPLGSRRQAAAPLPGLVGRQGLTNQITTRRSRGDIGAMMHNAHSLLELVSAPLHCAVICCLVSTGATSSRATSRAASKVIWQRPRLMHLRQRVRDAEHQPGPDTIPVCRVEIPCVRSTSAIRSATNLRHWFLRYLRLRYLRLRYLRLRYLRLRHPCAGAVSERQDLGHSHHWRTYRIRRIGVLTAIVSKPIERRHHTAGHSVMLFVVSAAIHGPSSR